MRKNSYIVAEYDYYTLDQARPIILEQEKERKRKLREDYIAALYMVAIPILFIIWWVIFGY